MLRCRKGTEKGKEVRNLVAELRQSSIGSKTRVTPQSREEGERSFKPVRAPKRGGKKMTLKKRTIEFVKLTQSKGSAQPGPDE